MLITKDMGIMEIVQKYPATVEVLQRFGMGCIGCAAAHFENIEQGALAHGIGRIFPLQRPRKCFT